jgi:hypothetical protein
MTVEEIVMELKKLADQLQHDPVYSDDAQWADGVIYGKESAAYSIEDLISRIED